MALPCILLYFSRRFEGDSIYLIRGLSGHLANTLRVGLEMSEFCDSACAEGGQRAQN